jgi:dihydrofolate synthase/folylpolyglutamate synthase
MQDKDISAMAQLLFPLFDEIILVLRDDTRAANLAQYNFSSFARQIKVVKGESAALALAETITPHNGLIVVTGSLHLLGAIKKILTV